MKRILCFTVFCVFLAGCAVNKPDVKVSKVRTHIPGPRYKDCKALGKYTSPNFIMFFAKDCFRKGHKWALLGLKTSKIQPSHVVNLGMFLYSKLGYFPRLQLYWHGFTPFWKVRYYLFVWKLL